MALPKPHPLALAAALALTPFVASQAQTAPAAAPAEPVVVAQANPADRPAPAAASAPAAAPAPAPAAADGLNLERIVVTGSTVLRSKFRQSVSVSNIDSEQLTRSVAASATEVLRAVPGLRAESTGGEGNANLGVRGLPMSDGGGRYVQLQEDGLPVLLFGDISFATADQFVRADGMVDGIDVLRGGSSATLSTNASGAIVNFLSKTGRNAGGSATLGVGLDHRQNRLDFDFGGSLGARTTFQIAGFQRTGKGTRNTNLEVEDGGQLRLALTREFDGGYVRVSLKQLNDRTPTYLPVPVRLNGNTIEEIPGVDPRTAFFINSNFAQDAVIDRNGNPLLTQPGNGLDVRVNSLGVEAQVDLGAGFSLTNRFRRSSIDGRFLGVFPAGAAPTDAANGADRYTGSTPAFSAHIFNTSLDDMGNVFNDARLQKSFNLGAAGRLGVTAGLFTGRQSIAQTWYWNRYNISLQGNGARLLDNNGATTNLPAAPGTLTWGGCCVRSFDYDITATAPYGAVSWDSGPLTVDASLRRDTQRGTGFYMEDTGTTGVWNRAGATRVNYRTSGTSWSVGANYELNKGLAVFGRASQGSSWKSPDRVLGDAAVATGANPYPKNEVDQFEGGVKWRQAGLSAFLTAFMAKTKEGAGFEITTRRVLADSYESRGLEAELGWRLGPLRVNAGATLTDAEITSGANAGKKPRRQADLVWQVSPVYTLGPLEIGGALIGTSKSYAQNDNQVVLPAFSVVNAFVNWAFSDRATVQLGVNNLLDTIGYTEAEGQGNLSNNPLYVARSINGRSVRASLKVSF
jgi:outer membrane receptor protein involved in Fe transport